MMKTFVGVLAGSIGAVGSKRLGSWDEKRADRSSSRMSIRGLIAQLSGALSAGDVEVLTSRLG